MVCHAHMRMCILDLFLISGCGHSRQWREIDGKVQPQRGWSPTGVIIQLDVIVGCVVHHIEVAHFILRIRAEQGGRNNSTAHPTPWGGTAADTHHRNVGSKGVAGL